MLSKGDILGIDDKKYATVHIPEWNGDVRIRSFTAREFDAWEQAITKANRDG